MLKDIKKILYYLKHIGEIFAMTNDILACCNNNYN